METDRPGRRRPAGSWLFLDSESRRQRNHEPRQPEIPKRKKSDIQTRLSCKIDYLLRSNHNDQSIASEFFTGDSFATVTGFPRRQTCYLFCVSPFAGFRRRTPAPPPFSSMNSTPAASKVRRIDSSLATVSEVSSSATSARRIVLAPRAASLARSAALHLSSARAARICALESDPLFILTSYPYGLIYPIWGDSNYNFNLRSHEMKPDVWTKSKENRRSFIGGSDARIIMGDNETALLRLWREKRGEVEPEDLSDNLIVQLGTVTEPLNRRWYERNTGQVVTEVQRRVFHPVKRWMAATLDGIVEGSGAVFEAKFMLPWSFSEEAAAEKHMPQLQHNMWVTASRTAVLSIITGGGKWVEMTIPADPLYQHLLLTAEKKFWRCVETGEAPHLLCVEPPKPRIEAVRIVDMSSSNSWAEFAGVFCQTRAAYLDHDAAKAELKKLMPEDAKEAIGHGIRAKRSKSGAISFDLQVAEVGHAALQ